MSEQGKSNLQVFGAGAGAFALVVALGGAALAAYSHLMSGAPAAPAAPPIDIAARTSGAPARAGEKRAESPAPVIGDMAEPDESSEIADALSSVAPKAAAVRRAEGGPLSGAAAAAAAPKLERVSSLPSGGASTTASAEVKAVAATAQKEAKKDAAPVEAAPDATVASKGEAVASTVQYGVTDRSSLMGRGAGPVYNLKGATPKGSQAARMKGAETAAEKLEQARQSVDGVPMPPEGKAIIDEHLKKAGETLIPAGAQ